MIMLDDDNEEMVREDFELYISNTTCMSCSYERKL